ncbi:glycosyltransferase [Paenibacillus sp. MBLB2552]|uniref:Glycosyltransferase n=1 Tax=Paenibacillus mellifer TaxID=2937794 RepID=A0A9X2BT20_9BACL|nr:glycosyltransferase [Paenibacillus mellifer]MCK8489035.1 glycosyltransferase [Paenibacillus mellifer]
MNYSVAVVVPVYNAEEFIIDTLESLSNQTHGFKEIIVVDDHSTDSTLQLIKDYVKQSKRSDIFLIENKQNRGVSYSRNKGTEMITSDWIMFFDADDIAEPDLVRTMIQQYVDYTCSRSEKYVLIHSAYRQMNDKGIVSELVTRFKQVDPSEILGYELVRNYVYLSGTMVKREAFLECGGFNEKMRYCEDWDLWIKLAAFGGFVYIDEPLVRIRRHSKNVSKNIEVILKSEKEVISKYSLGYIEKAINNRKLPSERNVMDYVNMLYRFDYWDEGLKKILKFTEQNRTYSPAFFLKGLYYIHHHLIDEALECFKEAIRLNSADAASYNNLGVCLCLKGHHSEAMEYFRCALNLVEGYMDCAHNLRLLDKFAESELLLGDFKITWRELRPVLLRYEN